MKDVQDLINDINHLQVSVNVYIEKYNHALDELTKAIRTKDNALIEEKKEYVKQRESRLYEINRKLNDKMYRKRMLEKR